MQHSALEGTPKVPYHQAFLLFSLLKHSIIFFSFLYRQREQIILSETFIKISNAKKSRTNKLRVLFPYFISENKWLPLFTGLISSSNGYRINNTYYKTPVKRFPVDIERQYNNKCLESSNKSRDSILIGWLNQGMMIVVKTEF